MPHDILLNMCERDDEREVREAMQSFLQDPEPCSFSEASDNAHLDDVVSRNTEELQSDAVLHAEDPHVRDDDDGAGKALTTTKPAVCSSTLLLSCFPIDFTNSLQDAGTDIPATCLQSAPMSLSCKNHVHHQCIGRGKPSGLFIAKPHKIYHYHRDALPQGCTLVQSLLAMSLTEVHRVPVMSTLRQDMITRFVHERYTRGSVPHGRVIKPLPLRPRQSHDTMNPFANLSL